MTVQSKQTSVQILRLHPWVGYLYTASEVVRRPKCERDAALFQTLVPPTHISLILHLSLSLSHRRGTSGGTLSPSYFTLSLWRRSLGSIPKPGCSLPATLAWTRPFYHRLLLIRRVLHRNVFFRVHPIPETVKSAILIIHLTELSRLKSKERISDFTKPTENNSKNYSKLESEPRGFDQLRRTFKG